MIRNLFIIALTLLSFNLSASHFIGGEITWECDTDPSSPDYGKYVFYMYIYQDCDGIDFSYTFPEYITVHNNPLMTTDIQMNFNDTNDISTTGVSSGGIGNCYDCDNQPTNIFGAVREWVYKSDPITISGTPPSDGWHFTWGTCCRSSLLTQGMADMDWTIRSVMYPYTDPSGTVLPNGNMCHDNSPIFKEKPKALLCTGYPFAYSHLAFDVDLDSISYSWSEPLGAEFSYNAANPISTALAFDPPYSAILPIPGNPTLNPNNGEISFLSNTVGVFVTCVKVAAFKCGQLVAEVYRDVNVALAACGTLPNGLQNSPPVITPPNGTQDWITTINSSTLPSYETTIMAGELVQFSVIATDNDINATGNLQNLALEVEGGQLDPNLALSNPASFIVTSSSPGNITGDFSWQSNCDHMQDYGCGRQGGAFTFNLKSYDDFCPANGIVIATITINVIPPQPDLRCVSVNGSGDVNLSFSFPEGVVDTNIQYNIYHSNQILGPFALIDSVRFPDTNYLHVSAGADLIKSYYYLLGNISCGSNLVSTDSLLYSDTLSSILMEVTAIDYGTIAELEWNQICTPLLSSSSLDYDLHYMNISGTDVIDTTLINPMLLTYDFMGDNCDYYPEFYVEISDESGCVSRSSIATINLLDTITPTTPQIKSVSVDNSGLTTLMWTNSINSGLLDTIFYIIYFQDEDGSWTTIDTVSDGLNSYIYNNSNADNYIESYKVRAIDSCGNARSRSLRHNTILLYEGINICDYSILFEWNKYLNWNNGVSHYKIFISELNNDNIISNSVNRITGNTEFLLQDVTALSSYTVYVEAYNEDSTYIARSNELSLNVDLPTKPAFNYIEYATVNLENGLIELSCIVDDNAIIDHYDVYRTDEYNINETGINFIKINEVNFTGNGNIVYTDDEADSRVSSYFYKIYPIDTCGVTQTPNPVDDPSYDGSDWYVKTILLNIEKNIDYSSSPSFANEFTNTISFNEYEKWLGEVSTYELFRSVNNEPYNILPLHTWNRESSPNEPLVFIDKVTNEGKGNGRFCYYIKATEGNATPYGSVYEGSYSNTICISQTPVIYMPNTFTPNNDEHNELFMPVTYFVSEVGYKFSIYNQSGAEIFSTETPLKGWDGTYKGKKVQNDNYVYLLQYLNGDNSVIEKTGVITLVR